MCFSETLVDLGRVIESEAEAHWSSLPSHFRLENPLRAYDREPIERDFMVSARLNHLHIKFMLRLAALRQLPPESDPQLLAVGNNILKLTVNQILHRDRLQNSGTSLVWRVRSLFKVSGAKLIRSRSRTMDCRLQALSVYRFSKAHLLVQVLRYLKRKSSKT